MPNEQSQLYCPVVIYLDNTFAYLNDHFGRSGLDPATIVHELLKELLNRRPGLYGMYGRGRMAAYNIMIPVQNRQPLEEVDTHFQVAKGILADEIVAVALSDFTPQTPYYYGGGENVILYLPLPSTNVSPECRANAIPYEFVQQHACNEPTIG